MGSLMCFEHAGVEQPSVHCVQPRGIFDGQHRACAAAQLLCSEHFAIDDDNDSRAVGGTREAGTSTSARGSAGCWRGKHDDFSVLVEVYPVRGEGEVNKLYLEVNKSESVREIDMP